MEGAVAAINGTIHALNYFSEVSRDYRLKVVPVTGLDRPVAYQTAVATAVRTDGNGLCLRISPSELLGEKLTDRLKQFLEDIGTTA